MGWEGGWATGSVGLERGHFAQCWGILLSATTTRPCGDEGSWHGAASGPLSSPTLL